MSNARAVTSAPKVAGDASKYEEEHVHAVYDDIASHFSSTRYKPWPIVSQFLSSLSIGSVGLDLGCGNGKYLALPSTCPPSVRTIGVDRSLNLLRIAKQSVLTQNEVVLGDAIQMPWRPGVFDYVISIATIHHLATHERRRQAIEIALRAASPSNGRILIYVWALEQDDQSKRIIPSMSLDHPGQEPEEAREKLEGVDVFVPWVYSTPSTSDEHSTSEGPQEPRVYNRYYHMFARGELRQLVVEAAARLNLAVAEPVAGVTGRGLTIAQDGWERSNYYTELHMWTR